MARFLIRHPDGAESSYELTKTETRIGRIASLVDLALPDGMASRIHSVVRKLQNGYTIVDLRSANHTYVNGERITERRLREGDTVKIGQTQLVFEPSQVAPLVTQTDVPMPERGTVMLAQPFLTVDPVGPMVTPEEIKQLRKKAATLNRLFDLSKTLASVFDLDKIFDHVSGLLFHETHADCAVIFIADARGELEAKLTKTRHKGVGPISVSRTMLRRAVDERMAVLVCDDPDAGDSDRSDTMMLQNIHSAICVPLLGTERLIGAVYVDRRSPALTLGADDLELIAAVGGQVSVAVEKAIAYSELSRAEVARAAYQRFLPAHVVEQILEAPDDLKLGGVTQDVTVIFADICGFTTLSEQAHPETVVEILNRMFSVLTEIVFEHGGTLDKYIGDALMALFGAPYVSPNDARNAVRAAVAMRRALPGLNEEFAALGFPRVDLSIGLHTGPATVGYIGSERRMDYTAIGDTVNIAARLQSAANAGQILVSDVTARAAEGSAGAFSTLGSIRVKGRAGEVAIFEVDAE